MPAAALGEPLGVDLVAHLDGRASLDMLERAEDAVPPEREVDVPLPYPGIRPHPDRRRDRLPPPGASPSKGSGRP